MEEFDKLCEAGKFDEAYCWLEKIYRENNWDSRFWGNYCRLYLGLEDDAIILVEHSLEFMDAISEAEIAYAFMAEYRHGEDDIKEALFYVNEGLRIAPKNNLLLTQASSIIADAKGELDPDSPNLPDSKIDRKPEEIVAELDELIQGYH